MTFTRTIEDFVCGHCGLAVSGNGYTNHCPQCLWSKHVDIDPGDRKATCEGLMQPVGYTDGKILHRCTTCGFKRKNRVGEEDSMDIVTDISKNPIVC